MEGVGKTGISRSLEGRLGLAAAVEVSLSLLWFFADTSGWRWGFLRLRSFPGPHGKPQTPRVDHWRVIVMHWRHIGCIPASYLRAAATCLCAAASNPLFTGDISPESRRVIVVRERQIGCSSATDHCPPVRSELSVAHNYLSPAHRDS